MLDTFLGYAVLLLMNVSLAYTAHLVVRRFTPCASVSIRIVSTGLLFYSLIILVFQLLSPFHAITRIWVCVLCSLIAVTTHCTWGKYRDLKAELQPVRLWVEAGLASRWAALIVICGFVILLSLSRALLMPPLAWDSITYHLTFAALWVKKGSLFLFKAPDQMQSAYFPINAEIFSAWLLLPFHSDLLVNLMNFPISLLGGICCYAIARELGLNSREASWAPALICFSPMVYSLITTSYADNAVFTFSAASVLFTLRFFKDDNIPDALLAFISEGILLGIKYNTIPLVGLTFFVIGMRVVKTKTLGFSLKTALLLLGIVLICILGGRQYINNCIDARNPIYPFPLKIFHLKIFEGWSGGDAVEKTIVASVLKKDKIERAKVELSKFCYRTLSAGPKFPLFFLMACVAPFMRTNRATKKLLYLLFLFSIVPVIILYADSSAVMARTTDLTAVNTRYFSAYIAFLTIAGLTVTRKLSHHFRFFDFFLALLIAWDLFHTDIKHIQEVAILYPAAVLLIPLFVLFYVFITKRYPFFKSNWAAYCGGFIIAAGALSALQTYRDSTRYDYYNQYTDVHSIPRDYVEAWRFLDNPDEKKVIAMAKGWDAVTHTWFFYPLMGSRLQNDIIYVSAKHRDEVPTWTDRGALRGEDVSLWLEKLKKINVGYVLVQTPWPIELTWMLDRPEKFLLVANGEKWRIFQCRSEALQTKASLLSQ